MLRTDGFTRVTRGLVIIGFALMFLMTAAILTTDTWRGASPLLELTPGDPVRGSLIPVAAVPATLFLLSVAWTYLLTGALHSHPLLRLLLLGLFFANHADFVGKLSAEGTVGSLLNWIPILAVVVVFAARWKRPARPSLEFPLILTCVASNLVLAQVHQADATRMGTGSLFLSSMSTSVLNLMLFVTPLLLLAGLDIAQFAHRVALWTGALAAEWVPRWGEALLLAVVLLWQVHDLPAALLEDLSSNGPAHLLLTLGVGALTPIWACGVWWICTRYLVRSERRPIVTEDLLEGVERVALPLIIIYFAFAWLSIVPITVTLVLAVSGVLSLVETQGMLENIARFSSMNSPDFGWRLFVAFAALCLGIWNVRKTRAGLGFVLLIFGFTAPRALFSAAGRPLEPYIQLGELEATDVCWTMLAAAVCIYWVARGRFHDVRFRNLITLTLVLLLLRQTNFISNRFSPIFGFAGVGLLALGLVWDALTIGSWANRDTRGLPRVGRVFLYVGYVLLAVTVVNWALTLHDLASIERLTGSVALDGFRLIGKPLLYALFALILGPALLPIHVETEAPPDD
jgi:hypothetical protein